MSDIQTIEEAQDTNRRLNRRLGATEAALHSLVSKSFDQVHEAHSTTRRALDRVAGQQDTIEWLQKKKQFEDKKKDKVFGGWLLFLWAVGATSAALWFGWR